MGNFLAQLAPYAKAIRGAVIAGVGAVLVALTNGDGITATEWCMVALAVLGTGESVYSTTNATALGVVLPGGSFPTPNALQPPAAGGGLQDLSGA